MDEVPERENAAAKESVQPTTGVSDAIPTPSVSPEPLPELEFELLDPERVYTLDQADYHSLYFLDGPYAIQNWEDEDEIEEKVFQCVQSYLEQELPNSFDDYAPESVKDEAARLSELERNLSDSQELQNLIEARKEIYQSYPKYSLAHMIAESYNRFGLEYIKVNGNFSTIEYYYGHSIQWLLRALSFSAIDSDAVRTRLSSIQMRYHDIASRAPVGSESGEYAQKLCEAFKRVANRI